MSNGVNMCITVASELPAWVGQLLAMGAVVLVGITLTAAFERHSARRERMKKVRCGCATRLSEREAQRARAVAASIGHRVHSHGMGSLVEGAVSAANDDEKGSA